MNVGQLIEQLKNYPQDLRVVVRGYEGGYNDVDQFETMKIVIDFNEEWYYGKHYPYREIVFRLIGEGSNYSNTNNINNNVVPDPTTDNCE